MALGNARRKLRNAMRMEDRGWGGWRSPVLLIPRSWRASARSGWLHGVLSLTNPIFWGITGCFWGCCPSCFASKEDHVCILEQGALASALGLCPGCWRRESGGDQVGTWQEQKLQKGQS